MYCHNCGKDVIEGGVYCSFCGSTLDHPRDDAGGRPLYLLKPVFLSIKMLAATVAWQIFLTLWAMVIFGIVGVLMISHFGWDTSHWYFVITAGAVFFVMTPVAYIIIMLNRYTRTEYRFYKDRLEYWEGYFRLRKKQLRYADMIEINLKRGILQRLSQLGDIVISSSATSASDGIAESGIRIFDIYEPDPVFNYLKKNVRSGAVS